MMARSGHYAFKGSKDPAAQNYRKIKIKIQGESSLSVDDSDYLKHIMPGVEGNGSWIEAWVVCAAKYLTCLKRKKLCCDHFL